MKGADLYLYESGFSCLLPIPVDSITYLEFNITIFFKFLSACMVSAAVILRMRSGSRLYCQELFYHSMLCQEQYIKKQSTRENYESIDCPGRRNYL